MLKCLIAASELHVSLQPSVAAGDELCIDYIDIRQGRQQRQFELRCSDRKNHKNRKPKQQQTTHTRAVCRAVSCTLMYFVTFLLDICTIGVVSAMCFWAGHRITRLQVQTSPTISKQSERWDSAHWDTARTFAEFKVRSMASTAAVQHVLHQAKPVMKGGDCSEMSVCKAFWGRSKWGEHGEHVIIRHCLSTWCFKAGPGPVWRSWIRYLTRRRLSNVSSFSFEWRTFSFF